MKLILIDIENRLTREWEKEFKSFSNIQIICGNIFDYAEDTVVSPANGYGMMDGGIDGMYTDYFGFTPQENARKIIIKIPEGALQVGQSILVQTGHKKIPNMIIAPTMVVPEMVEASNCYFAMSAILKCASKHSDKIKQVYCPGLCTLTGKVPYNIAAKEMANAYKNWLNKSNTN